MRKRGNSIRIIGGEWRGRRVDTVRADGLRPTMDRVREQLANWLMPYYQGAHCLDLFAGSGALGLEALSRGANHVDFVEKHARVASQLQQNLDVLSVDERYKIVQIEALKFLSRHQSAPYDIVFIDPPFVDKVIPEVLVLLEKGRLVSEGGFAYIEYHSTDALVKTSSSWQLFKQGQAGDSQYQLYRFVCEV